MSQTIAPLPPAAALPTYDLFLHTILPLTVTPNQVMYWILRWDIGGDPNERLLYSFSGGSVDGVKLRRMTQGAWQAHLTGIGFGRRDSRLCAIDIERAKILEQEEAKKAEKDKEVMSNDEGMKEAISVRETTRFPSWWRRKLGLLFRRHVLAEGSKASRGAPNMRGQATRK